jgi:glycosyltransferase involved in cell wall biosynthesis
LMKSILIFAGYFYPHVGGYEKSILGLSRILVDKGYSVDIITCNTEKASNYEELDRITIYRLQAWNLLNGTYPVPKFFGNGSIRRAIMLRHYDVIITQTRFFTTSLLGIIWARLKGIPVIHVEHGTVHTVLSSRLLGIIGKIYDHVLGTLVVKLAQVNVGGSVAACEFARHLGARNTLVIHNGVDPNVFQKRPSECRQKFGFSDSDIIVTFVGRLIYAKGAQDLIRAFSNITESELKMRLIIVGDGPYRNELEQLISQNGKKADIIMVGQKDQEQLVDILSITDIFVNPSYSEGFPTSVLEAASIGIPVIATDVGGTKEIITDNNTGILVQAGNVNQLENKLHDLSTDKELRMNLANNGRALVTIEFGWNTITSQWNRLMNEVPRVK